MPINGHNRLRVLLHRTFIWLAGIFVAIFASNAIAQTCYDSISAHQCVKTENPIDACQEFVNADPYDLQARFSLCEVHVRAGAPLKALVVLDQGLARCGKDRNRCDRLEKAIDALEKASNQMPGSAELRAQQEENRKTCTSRKRQPVHQAIIACEEALIAFPQDPDLHGSYGEKLLQGKQPARAVLAFRKALVLRPGDPNFLSWHDAAEDARQTMVERCLRHTDLQNCNEAIIPGSKDEVRLHRQRSKLYLQQGNRPAALEAMLIVQVIDPRDVRTSQELLRLVPADTRITDERLYLPRGRALLETGDLRRAILDLRRASRRSLDRDIANTELRRAREMRKTMIEAVCLATGDINACQELIIEGEPDEPEIRNYIASLSQPAPRESVPLVVQEQTVAIESVIDPVREPEPLTIEPQKANSVDTKPKADKPPQPVVLAASYFNLASDNGATH